MNTNGGVLDVSSEVSSSYSAVLDEVPLLVFRVIGCTVVTLLVGFTIIIYITTGMFHVDCLAQICCETCIFAAYMLLLLTTTESFRINTSMCQTISIFLHFFFVAASLFLLLEVVCICQARVAHFPRALLLTDRNILFVGWICPAVVTGISAILWFNNYTTKTNCWLNINQAPYWITMIPISICISIQFLLILTTVAVSDVPITLPASLFKRSKIYRTTRWASGILGGILLMSWNFGVTAYHTNQESFYGAFTVSSILLGVCTFILRISMDDEMREKISSHLITFIAPNRVSASNDNRVIVVKKQDLTDKMEVMKNGKIPRNGHFVPHK